MKNSTKGVLVYLALATLSMAESYIGIEARLIEEASSVLLSSNAKVSDGARFKNALNLEFGEGMKYRTILDQLARRMAVASPSSSRVYVLAIRNNELRFSNGGVEGNVIATLSVFFKFDQNSQLQSCLYVIDYDTLKADPITSNQ